MKNIFYVFLLLVGIGSIHSQGNDLKQLVEEKVNQDVWKPFKKSYEAKDWQTFNSLHTDDVLRAHDHGIQIGQEYKDAIKGYYEREDERKTSIDFVMERRTYKDNVGYEVGFYRVIYSKPGEDDYISYGRFHVVLKKVDGQWKIAQDWDSSSFNGRPIGADDFDKGAILDLNQ